ncbi:MAG TPA: 2,4-dihydroxyhept-2-ene-1,7-dioic acid aldolase [Cytophagales bacterium]|nr:2,4-dihydroxyhept-2-ene-1,7-dioic acid aldolase [Cytophagales bacterium]
MNKSNTPLLGVLLTLDAPEVSELVAAIGYDWVMIDMEHSTLDLRAVQGLLQAIGQGCETIVRVPSAEEEWIKRVLDTGCSGIMVPQVNTAELAAQVVQWSKYPPQGGRSVGIGRAHGYGRELGEYLAKANAKTKILAQIEHIEAVTNLESIVQTPGLDALFIGPYDLSGSMGLPGQVQHPQVQSAVQQVIQACLVHNMPFGLFGGTPEALTGPISQGCTYVLVGTDMLVLGQGLERNLASLRQKDGIKVE